MQIAEKELASCQLHRLLIPRRSILKGIGRAFASIFIAPPAIFTGLLDSCQHEVFAGFEREAEASDIGVHLLATLRHVFVAIHALRNLARVRKGFHLLRPVEDDARFYQSQNESGEGDAVAFVHTFSISPSPLNSKG